MGAVNALKYKSQEQKDRARKGHSSGRAFSETRRNRGERKVAEQGFMTLPAREDSGFLGDAVFFPFLLTGLLQDLMFPPLLPPASIPCTSLLHSLLPLAHLCLPAPSMLVHRPLIPKHPPLLCETIHRVILLSCSCQRMSSQAFKQHMNKATCSCSSSLTRSHTTQITWSTIPPHMGRSGFYGQYTY